MFVLFFKDDEIDILHFEFVPSLESDTVADRFISDYPEVLIKNATPIPIMCGINSTEGLIAFGGKAFVNCHLQLSTFFMKSNE